jgi:hypothetical protein
MANKRKGRYGLKGHGITDPVVLVKRPDTLPPGTPIPVTTDQTPVQPIMITVPAPAVQGKQIDIWHLIAAIVVAVVLSGAVSLTLAIAFRTETLEKIDKVERRVDGVDREIRTHDTKITRIKAGLDNDH